ncbi:MAG: prepilin-type N-terminal cleavage/methylation domain-containing protein [Candidatus Omnitrophota bacterium]
MRRNKGFTAVELIVSVCIFSMVAYAVYSLLAGGLNAYKRIRNFAGSQIDVLTAFEKIERDLENTFYISGINFSGDSTSVSFAGSSPIAKVTYLYDGASGKLIRREQSYACAMSDSGTEGITSAELAPLKELAFRYCRYNEEEETCEWSDIWESATIPLAVEMTASFDSGGKTLRIKRIVFIPVSQ